MTNLIPKVERYGHGAHRVLIIAGLHGNELTPIVCCSMLKECLDTIDDKFEKVTMITSVNMTGLRAHTRNVPPNNSSGDMNRVYVNDNIEQSELLRLAKSYDTVIDVHSSPNCTEFILIDQDELANSYVSYAKENEIKYCVRYSAANTVKKSCNMMGKAGFTVELNGMMPDVDSAKRGVELIKKLISSKVTVSKEQPTHSTYTELLTHHEGIFVPHKSVGDVVGTGDVVGHLLSPKTLEKVDVIWDGREGTIIAGNEGYVLPGKYIYWIQPN